MPPGSPPLALSRPVELSIVMPCLNEVRTLQDCIEKARANLNEHGIDGEIIISDNGSTDGSIELARELGARVIHAQERGYGAALQAGIAAARGEFIVMGDCDGSYDFNHSHRFVEKLREGHDLVMGNRFAGGIEGGAMPKLHRYFGNPVLSALGRQIFGKLCGDFYCGLRGFRKSAFDQLQVRSPGMEFALEMVAKMTMFGMRVTEVPTTLSPDGRDRKPHLRTWRDGWRSLRLFSMLSPKWLFWYPGLALMGLGFALGIPLTFGPVELFGLTLDIHSLAAAAAMITVGAQSALFAILAKATAVRSGLHPPSGKVEATLRAITLESGLRIGIGLAIIGVLGMILAVQAWASQSYGDLDPFRTMRQIIPALLAVILGAEFILAAFFLSFTGFVEQSRRESAPTRLP